MSALSFPDFHVPLPHRHQTRLRSLRYVFARFAATNIHFLRQLPFHKEPTTAAPSMPPMLAPASSSLAGSSQNGDYLSSLSTTYHASSSFLLRKGKLVSFFPLKDSYGTTQLILNHSQGFPELSALKDVPIESSVLIEGTVLLRPQEAKRPVCLLFMFYFSHVSHHSRSSRAPLAKSTSRWRSLPC